MSLLQFENPRFKGLGEAEIAIMRQVGAHENVVRNGFYTFHSIGSVLCGISCFGLRNSWMSCRRFEETLPAVQSGVLRCVQVSMVDHFQDKQCLYIILERCDGGELMQRIQQDNIFSEKVASAYFRQILLGVQHCHRRLVVHRWVKHGLYAMGWCDYARVVVFQGFETRKLHLCKARR